MGKMLFGHFETFWLDNYHKRKVLRVDAGGALPNSEEFLAFCSSFATRMEPVAGEAPWQMGRHS